jgi:hypothetical protein
LPERQKIVLSKPAEENKEDKLEDFRKHIVGLDKKMLFLDNSSKRYVNTKDIVMTKYISDTQEDDLECSLR